MTSRHKVWFDKSHLVFIGNLHIVVIVFKLFQLITRSLTTCLLVILHILVCVELFQIRLNFYAIMLHFLCLTECSYTLIQISNILNICFYISLTPAIIWGNSLKKLPTVVFHKLPFFPTIFNLLSVPYMLFIAINVSTKLLLLLQILRFNCSDSLYRSNSGTFPLLSYISHSRLDFLLHLLIWFMFGVHFAKTDW